MTWPSVVMIFYADTRILGPAPSGLPTLAEWKCWLTEGRSQIEDDGGHASNAGADCGAWQRGKKG